MKKNYLKPQIEEFAIHTSGLIAQSLTGTGAEIHNTNATGEAEGRGGDFFDED